MSGLSKRLTRISKRARWSSWVQGNIANGSKVFLEPGSAVTPSHFHEYEHLHDVILFSLTEFGSNHSTAVAVSGNSVLKRAGSGVTLDVAIE